MCANQEILHQNDFGYVTICKGCEHLSVGIGNFMAVFTKKTFKAIIKDLNKVMANPQKHTFVTIEGKRVLTRLSENSYLTQTIDDFKETVLMLEMANHYLKVLDIIKK